MRIDFNTVDIANHTGYGNASRLIVESLGRRGVEMHPGSPVMLNFCMPSTYKYSAYTIGYTPWESTEVPKSWLKGLNDVDDMWTTSTWVADIFQRYRMERPFVVPHGIEPCWTRGRHYREDRPFTFVHVGEPAERKGGEILLDAWYRHFRGRKDVCLIYKCVGYPMARVKDKSGSILASPGSLDNVIVHGNVYNQAQMWKLYRDADCMVYPTRGEGFGLIPFEAMATGLPTILPAMGGTRDFAPLSELTLHNSMWTQSTSEVIHPGLWLDHDVDELIYLMEDAMSRFDYHCDYAFRSAEEIHARYSWDRVATIIEDRISDALIGRR